LDKIVLVLFDILLLVRLHLSSVLSHTILNKNKSLYTNNLHNYQQATITRLAQLEERSTFNRVVVGSIPTSGVLFAQVPFGLHPFCWLLTMVFLLILTPKKKRRARLKE
jgi:hypothetical protein